MIKAPTKEELANLTTISIHIDNQWTIYDFTACFKSFECLYSYYQAFYDLNKIIEQEENIKFSSIRHKSSESLSRVMFNKMFENIERSPFDISSPLTLYQQFLSAESTELRLKKIQYASPGSIDFIGIGEIFKSVKELITHYIPNKKEHLENELLKQKIIEGDIKILKSLGHSDMEIKTIIYRKELATDVLTKLIETKKVRTLTIQKK